MRVSCMCQMGAAFLSAVFASGTGSPTCDLFDEFPDKYSDKNASVSRLVVVTLNDGDDFCRLLALESKHPLQGQPPMGWCWYMGFDRDYHYAEGLRNPDEIYRVRRDAVSSKQIARVFEQRQRQNHDSEGTTISLPVPKLAGQWFLWAKLDSSLIPLDMTDVPDRCIVFENTGNTDLEWLTVSGLSITPPCNELISKGQKASGSNDPLPATITITWRLKGQPDQTTAVVIPDAARRARIGELRLKFAEATSWSATFKESTFKE